MYAATAITLQGMLEQTDDGSNSNKKNDQTAHVVTDAKNAHPIPVAQPSNLADRFTYDEDEDWVDMPPDCPDNPTEDEYKIFRLLEREYHQRRRLEIKIEEQKWEDLLRRANDLHHRAIQFCSNN